MLQLLQIVLYANDGEQRVVNFKPGALNIITGESRTGKSALLSIVEYCLGRSTPNVPAGPVTDTVAWYGCLWQISGTARAFVGRPAPSGANASTQRAMLELGGADLTSPEVNRLQVNADVDSLRGELGAQIGLTEAQVQSSGRDDYAVTLGSAALFCFQAQDEIASRSLLFHRQGEQQLAQVLKDTLPYYLGAVVGDEAGKRSELRRARQILRRSEANLANAEEEAAEIEAVLSSLLIEAASVGLTAVAEAPSAAAVLQILTRVRYSGAAPVEPSKDLDLQDNLRELDRRRVELEDDLSAALADRALLLDRRDGARGFEGALELQIGRLTPLELLDPADSHEATNHGICPVCAQSLPHEDPTVKQLSGRLLSLRNELADLAAAEPSRRKTLVDLDSKVTSLRSELQIVNDAMVSLSGERGERRATSDQREFVRGRIDASLSRREATDQSRLNSLRERAELARERVTVLEAEVASDRIREQLTSRLISVGRDMTSNAQALNLEHSESPVRLDVADLTVVADTETGPVKLGLIGSAANWIGYHLAAHLALHRFFRRQHRPVPAFLMLDQPSQAYYQSDSAKVGGVPESDADKVAVTAMFDLMRRATEELAPDMQIIVIDHANLDDEWFQQSVIYNWRGGEKLIPQAWLKADDEPSVMIG
jgi:hypothetical protein